MVDQRVLEAVRELFAHRRLRFLVTGGTGFVGSRLAKLLADADQIVTIAGRNRYRSSAAWHPKLHFVSLDVCNAMEVEKACRDHDVVIHAAALASAWGPTPAFHEINVSGTENVVNACQSSPGIRLVHVSSTAIHFEFRDKLFLPEDAPLPKQFACEYAKTKALAEEVVQGAAARGLNAIIIRARAVFGPGDNALLPRLLTAASQGRLPRIGPGNNQVDLTYVDNLVFALCLASIRGEAGEVCTITNEEPILLWPILDRMFEHLQFPKIRKRLSYPTAMMIAKIATRWNQAFSKTTEPILTDYGVGLLSKSQTFSSDAAHRVLDYRPIVSMEQATQHTLDALTSKDDSAASSSVGLKLFTTGYTPQPYFLIQPGAGWMHVPCHATCALLEHPKHGLFLFDTGYSNRFIESTQSFPYSIYGRVSPIVHSPSLTIRSQLAEQGVAPKDIRGVILSHFHADHVAGLRDFAQSELVASQSAWNDVNGRRGFSALRRGFLPSLLPGDFKDRFHPIEYFHDPGIGPFERCHDLFGDGSVRLIPIPGHARGQIGALVQTAPDKRVFLAADATWTRTSLRSNRLPHWVTFSFIDSIRDLRQTLDRLHRFSNQYPDIDIVPTHCPEIAQRYGFDAFVKDSLAQFSER